MGDILAFLTIWEVVALPTILFYLVIAIVGGVSPAEIDEGFFVLERDIFLLFYCLMFWAFLAISIVPEKIAVFCFKFKYFSTFNFILILCVFVSFFLIVQTFRPVTFFLYKEDAFFLISFLQSLMYVFFIQRFRAFLHRLFFFVATYFCSYLAFYFLVILYLLFSSK